MNIECPHCEKYFEVEPEFYDGQTEDFEAECPHCEEEVVYDVEFDPVSINERKMPECRMFKHVYGEKEDRGHYLLFKCVHCGKTKHTFKEEI